MSVLDRAMRPLRDRVRMMVGRAVIAAIDDGTSAQSVQLKLLAGEVQDGVERFQEYGFTSAPHAGAEAAVVFVGGLRSHGIVVGVEDRRYRLKGLQGGEVALYDDLGQSIRLGRDGILLTSPMKVIIDSPQVALGGEGGPAVARIGDTVAGGMITGGSTKVTAA